MDIVKVYKFLLKMGENYIAIPSAGIEEKIFIYTFL